MEATAAGVLSHLSFLELQTRDLRAGPQQPDTVKELRSKVLRLTEQRDRLKAEIHTHQNLQKLRGSMDKRGEEEEEMDEDSEKWESSDLLCVMSRHAELSDLLTAHQLIGGYNMVKTRQGRGVCVSIATAYEGVYLDTYNLELDLKPTLRIARHNVPPFIPLDEVFRSSRVETGVRNFMDSLSQLLNAWAGRKQQFTMVKERFQSVDVMDSNVVCSLLVLALTVPRVKTSVLCSLDYSDRTRSLPSRVTLHCDDENLPDSPRWKRNHKLLMETPVHRALEAMRKDGSIR